MAEGGEKMEVTKQTTALLSGILIAMSVLLLVNMANISFLDIFGEYFGLNTLPGFWHTIILAVIGLTLLSEVFFGKNGFEYKKKGDLFIFVMAIVAFGLAFQVSGYSIEIPVMIQPYIGIAYVLLVVALIYALKTK